MKKIVPLLLLVASAFATLIFIPSCKDDDDAPVMTLYDSLGGTKMVADPIGGAMIEQGRLGIRSVVDSTIFVIAADTQLNTKFFSVLLAEVGAGNLTGYSILSKNLTDFFCVATGAKNYSYNGLDMVSAHDPAVHNRIGSKINNAEFDRFVADLVTGAQKVGLSNQLIGQVGAVVETTRSQVVQN